MRPLLTTARLASRSLTPLARPAVSPVVRPAPAVLQHLARRPLTSTRPNFARYDRFDTPSYGQGGSGLNNVHNFFRRRLGGDRGVYIFGIAVGGGIIYYVVHLERVPETGRLRFMDCSPEMEAEMGAATFNETMQEFGGKILPVNHPVSRRVRAVAQSIIEKNGLGRMKSGHTLSSVEGIWDAIRGDGSASSDDIDKNTEWEVYVVDDPKTKNAFVIPGGKIFVFTGILPVSANDDGLATVLGHEVAHVVARHGAERMSYMKVLFAVSFLLESLGLDVGLTRLFVTFLLQLPNSRSSETEADTIGLNLMSKACFNPAEAPQMWQRMAAGEGRGGGLDFMSTHPASGKRIKALSAQLPEAEQIRNQKCANTSQMADSFGSQYGNQYGTQFGGAWR